MIACNTASSTLSWASPAVLQTVTQNLGGGQTRTVTFSGWTLERADSFSFNGKQWAYTWVNNTTVTPNVVTLTQFTPPAGGSWSFAYAADAQGKLKVTSVATPNGGQVAYTWAIDEFPTTPSNRVAIRTRATSGPSIDPGTWTFDWLNLAAKLLVTAPHSVTVTYDLTEGHATNVRVDGPGGEMQREVRTFITVPGPVDDVPVLQVRTITRDQHHSVTGFTYGSANYSNYGQPTKIEELGLGPPRTTDIVYKHDFTSYIRGRVQQRTVTSGGQSYVFSTAYDGATGFVTSSTALGRTTTYTNDGKGNVASVTDANSHTAQFTYEWGVLKNATSATGVATTRTINSTGTVATETAGGVTMTFGYDDIGRVTSVTPGSRAAITTAYYTDRTEVSRGGQTVKTYMDGFGRPISALDPNGVQTKVTYDKLGRQIYASYPFGGSVSEVGVSTTLDAIGRPLSITKPGGATTTYAYSTGGTVVQITEQVAPGQTRTTTHTYQSFGDPDDRRLVRLDDPAGTGWVYEYDGLGNLRVMDSVTSGFQTTPRRTWTYNAQNLLTQESHPADSGTTSYTYDAVGNRISKTDARNITVTYGYDNDNRLVSVDAPGTDDDVTYTYNSLGYLTAIGSAAVQTSFTYNEGRLASRTDVMSGRTFVQSFAYDTLDQLTSHTYPSGRQVLYTYAGGRVTAVKTLLGAGPEKNLATGLSYTGAGALSGWTYGNSLARTTTFDARQRPIDWDSGPLDLTYAYDYVGNVTSITDPRAGFSASYQYDALDRLTTVTGYMARSYTYDRAGNRLTASGMTYTYSGDKLTSVSGTINGSFTYSANGNVRTDPDGGTYFYTAQNLLKTAAFGGATTTYKYGGDGYRNLRIKPNGTEQYFIRAGGNLIAEYEAAGAGTNITREYIYLGSSLLASFEPSTATIPGLSVSVTTPVTGQTLTAGQAITLGATVTVPAGTTVSRVEYYNDGHYVGQATSAPYAVTFTNQAMTPGQHTMLARAVTTTGKAVTSAPITFITQ